MEQPSQQRPHHINCASPWDQGVMLYLDEPSPDGPEHVEMVFIEPTGINRYAIDEDRSQSERLDIVETIRESTCNVVDDGSWVESELVPLLEGTFIEDGSTDVPEQMQTYRNLVADIVRYNCRGDAMMHRRHSSSNVTGDSAWVEREMREQWAERYNTETGRELQEYKVKLRELKEAPASRESEQEQRHYEKRVREANKKMWARCRSVTLAALARQLRNEQEEPLQELQNLQDLYDIQRAELNYRCFTKEDLLAAVDDKRSQLNMALDGSMSLVDMWVEILDQLLDTTAANMRRVQTRVGRLMARDVRDEAERKIEMRMRLDHPEALDFMFRAWSDVEATKSIADSMQRLAGEMEAELERVAMTAADAIGAEKDVVLSMELSRYCQQASDLT